MVSSSRDEPRWARLEIRDGLDLGPPTRDDRSPGELDPERDSWAPTATPNRVDVGDDGTRRNDRVAGRSAGPIDGFGLDGLITVVGFVGALVETLAELFCRRAD